MSSKRVLMLCDRLRLVMRRPRLFVRAAHAAIFVFSALIAFLLRFDFVIPKDHIPHLVTAVAVWIVIKPITFHLLRLDRGWWRFVSISDVARIGSGNLIAS